MSPPHATPASRGGSPGPRSGGRVLAAGFAAVALAAAAGLAAASGLAPGAGLAPASGGPVAGGPMAGGPASGGPAEPSPGLSSDTLPFRHGDHANLDCQTCHANARPTVRANQVWCAECHHEGVGFDRCGECHPASDLARPYGVRQRLGLTAGGATSRALPFDHTDHTRVACGTCHRGAPMPTADRPCADCHADHHRAESSCLACHEKPPEGAHALEVHTTGCAGSGCHGTTGREVAALGDAPNVCLSCHQEQRDHERGEWCTRCHLLGTGSGEARPGGAG